MKKKTMILVLIAVAITVALVCTVGIIIKPSESPQPSQRLPPPPIPPAKFETAEIKLGENALVRGNLIKVISIEEKGIVKIEVQNETTGEPMVVPFNFVKGGYAFKYKNITMFPVKVEDNRVTFSIGGVALRNEE